MITSFKLINIVYLRDTVNCTETHSYATLSVLPFIKNDKKMTQIALPNECEHYNNNSSENTLKIINYIKYHHQIHAITSNPFITTCSLIVKICNTLFIFDCNELSFILPVCAANIISFVICLYSLTILPSY